MSFQYPLGLLGLIGVPILILIYIIKSKFTEQTVSATYLWTLSERFLKKKRKDNKITGLISLILQILAVVIISFTIAHPVFTLTGAAKEYCFVLDSTGSMNMVSREGKTRFELGKDKIKEIIEDSVDGSNYTLISVSNDVQVLYEREKDREAALKLLEKAEQGYGYSNFEDATRIAEEYYNENTAMQTYLVTDKKYSSVSGAVLLDVSDSKNNYAIFDVEYEYSAIGDLKINGKAISYGKDDELEIVLYIDGETKAEYKITKAAIKDVPIEFSYELNLAEYNVASIKLLNNDDLMLDNESVIYNVKSENSYETLLVSKTPVFLETALSVVSNADITIMDPDTYLEYEKENSSVISGYDLYIFHSCNPKAVPRDGSVWLINTSASVENSGFGYQNEEVLDIAEKIDKTRNTSSIIRDQLLKDVSGKDIYISKYSRYDTSNRRFYVLFTFDGNPVIFTGTNMYGNRQVVFGFDLHNSDLPLSADFIILTKNLLDFSFPTVIDETYYECGDTAEINVVSGTESIRVESPSGKLTHIGVSEAVGEVQLNEVGTYNIKVATKDGLKTYRIYSASSAREQNPQVGADEEFSLSVKDGAKTNEMDGFYDKLIILFICLAVIFVADWVVYCYDKYQLR